MYAIIEVNHADFGPLFDTLEEAQESLGRMGTAANNEGFRFAIFALDDEGFPVGEELSSVGVSRG